MSPRALLVCAALLAPTVALAITGGCGTTVSLIDQDDTGSGGEGGFLFLDGGGGEDRPDAGGKDALPDVDDPGCPNKPPPIEDFQCDPYSQFNGDCAAGEGCYIFVDYPSQPCGQEIYGSFCYFAGPGGQGDPCGSALDCNAGHVCVITGAGTQCVQLCSLFGEDGCPDGLLCETIDVEGFGGCL
jgi:hypothetical protein